MPMPAQYWYFLIGGPTDDSMGLVANFYAYGQHCGEALANALQAANEKLGISQPEATEAARLDILDDFEEQQELVRFNDLVSSGATTYSYPLDSPDKDFIPPTGIIKAAQEGEFAYELVKDGFVALHDEEANSFEFELAAGKEKLVATFLQSLTFLPAIDRLEIGIKGDWHNEKSELWAIEANRLPNSLAAFLLENKENILHNGFVECTAVLDDGATRLTLNEHKKINLQTQDQSLFNRFSQEILALGFEQTTELYNLEYGFYHWHYRPAHSLDAPELRVLLLATGFNFVESWDEESDQQ